MRRTAGIFTAAVLVLGGLTACSSTAAKGDSQAVSTTIDDSTTTPTSESTSGVSSDPGCTAVGDLMQQSDATGSDAAESQALLDRIDEVRADLPAELSGDLDALVGFAQAEVDASNGSPLGTSPSPEALRKMGQDLESMTHAGYDMDRWYRHHCGPESAASPWCDAVAAAEVDRGLAFARMLSSSSDPSSASGSGLDLMDQADVAFFVALRAAAPQELWPSLDVIVGQYQANGGSLPDDDASTKAVDDAKSTIGASIATDCSESLGHID